MTKAREKITFTPRTILRYVILKKVLLGMFCLFYYWSPLIFVNGLEWWVLWGVLGTDMGIDIIYSFIIWGIAGIEKEIATTEKKKKRRWKL